MFYSYALFMSFLYLIYFPWKKTRNRITQNNVFPLEIVFERARKRQRKRYRSWHSTCECCRGYKLFAANIRILLLILKCFVFNFWLSLEILCAYPLKFCSFKFQTRKGVVSLLSRTENHSAGYLLPFKKSRDIFYDEIWKMRRKKIHLHQKIGFDGFDEI